MDDSKITPEGGDTDVAQCVSAVVDAHLTVKPPKGVTQHGQFLQHLRSPYTTKVQAWADALFVSPLWGLGV